MRVEFAAWEKNGRKPPSPSLFKQGVVLHYGKEYRLRTLVETGTYLGATVNACKDAFDRIYSIELNDDFFVRARRKFASCPHITVLQGDSAEVLPSILSQLQQPALFWLDAHYSGGQTAKAEIETPIMRELALIFAHHVKGHVILIDDARCFDGTHDYPTRAAVSALAQANQYRYAEQDDIIRLVP